MLLHQCFHPSRRGCTGTDVFLALCRRFQDSRGPGPPQWSVIIEAGPGCWNRRQRTTAPAAIKPRLHKICSRLTAFLCGHRAGVAPEFFVTSRSGVGLAFWQWLARRAADEWRSALLAESGKRPLRPPPDDGHSPCGSPAWRGGRATPGCQWRWAHGPASLHWRYIRILPAEVWRDVGQPFISEIPGGPFL